MPALQHERLQFGTGIQQLVRLYQRNGLPSVSSIDPEVPIQCHDYAIWMLLTHAHQAGISQRHGNLDVSSHEISDRLHFVLQTEGHPDKFCSGEVQDSSAAAMKVLQKETRLGQHGLAG